MSSHVRSRIVKVDFLQNDSHHLIERRDTFASIKWYPISRLLGEILQFFIVYIESVLHTYSPRKSQKKLGLVHPIRTNLSLCIIFYVFALLNLRLHRRVKLLVLASSPLEFRVLFTGCHVAAAIYHHRIIIITAAIYHHRHHRCHIPPSSSPLPYTTYPLPSR